MSNLSSIIQLSALSSYYFSSLQRIYSLFVQVSLKPKLMNLKPYMMTATSTLVYFTSSKEYVNRKLHLKFSYFNRQVKVKKIKVYNEEINFHLWSTNFDFFWISLILSIHCDNMEINGANPIIAKGTSEKLPRTSTIFGVTI